MRECYVIIAEIESDIIVNKIECENKRSAEKVENGVNVSLNNDKFYTYIEEKEPNNVQ